MTTAADVIAVARAEVGYREGRSASGRPNNQQKYSPGVPGLEWSNWQAWCQTFQSWVFRQAGAPELAPVTASCLSATAWFKARGRFSEYPAIGAQVFFGAGGGSHVGLVYAYDRDYAYTIEGNTNATGSPEGDGVYLKKRLRRDPYLYGYGYPAYPGGIVSADPRYGGQNTATEPRPTPVVVLRHLLEAVAADIPAPTGHTTYPGYVELVEWALEREGLLERAYAHDGSWGTKTRDAYAAWQRRCNYTGSDADGTPGRDSLTRLGARHGFTVVE